ncbi:MAG: winged helix-turn-helix transcriptional regulator [Methanomicrobiales archaeon]|jgi:ATP-dependent DNA helicase RecG|nr:winged helix-turn-helix transcriptional regulator [Methanomicrobiales archaeon]
MMENQSLEWKRQWRDDFLKGLSGLANAQGGVLEIGRNDAGIVVGIDNAKELLEELPNTIRHALGIVPSVELLTEQGKQYIVVSVDASSTPVSFHGRHYLRSGSTTQELTGSELDNFILRRLGKTWDSIIVPKITVTDLDTSAFRKFREKSLASERLQKVDLEMSDEALLDSLLLIENGELTRAAILLFHNNPEKYVFGAFVKVGYFESGADLIYEDEFHGPLIAMPDEIVDTIYRKYFKGIISYEGLQRIANYPVPLPALREAILNAIVHRDYTTGIPIQIKVFPNCVIVYNDGRLPENWTVANLLKKHRSRPYNPKIAYAFYRAGYIETWGRGIERITTACKDAGKPEPLFEASSSEISVTFYTDTYTDTDVGVKNDVKNGVGVNETQKAILLLMRETPTISAQRIADIIGITKRRIESNIHSLKKAGIIKRLGSDKTGHWIVNYTETWEQGVERGATAYKDENKPEPLSGASPSEMSVTLYTDTYIDTYTDTDVGVKNGVNETQKAILFLMRETPTISAQRIANATGIMKWQIESNIRSLKKAGIIKRVGSNKTGHWVVNYTETR